MLLKRNLALTLSFILGFAVLAVLFSALKGVQVDVLMALAVGAGVSVFVLWAASARSPRDSE